jgi:hypothetical protein
MHAHNLSHSYAHAPAMQPLKVTDEEEKDGNMSSVHGGGIESLSLSLSLSLSACVRACVRACVSLCVCAFVLSLSLSL